MPKLYQITIPGLSLKAERARPIDRPDRANNPSDSCIANQLRLLTRKRTRKHDLQ